MPVRPDLTAVVGKGGLTRSRASGGWGRVFETLVPRPPRRGPPATHGLDRNVDRLHTLGKEAEAYFPENGPHGFYFGGPKPIPETEEAARRAVAFMRKHFAP
jgi:hypothetical protein